MTDLHGLSRSDEFDAVVERSLNSLHAGQLRPSADETASVETGIGLPEGQVLLGVDHEGRSHILVPTDLRPNVRGWGTRGIAVKLRKVKVEGKRQVYLDLYCTEVRLDPIFRHFKADLLRRLSASQMRGIRVVKDTLSIWRDLFAERRQGLSSDEIVGLVGELEILKRLAELDPGAAFETWRGSTRALQDFRGEMGTLEVKTRKVGPSQRYHINGLDQLDPESAPGLHFVGISLLDSPDADGIRERFSELIHLGVPESGLEVELGKRGYVRSLDLGGADRFVVASCDAWPVTEGFPRISQKDLPPAMRPRISECTYVIETDGLAGRLESASLAGLWRRVVGHG